MHRGGVPAARRELVSAERLWHLLTYAVPYFAVQARIELTRVHLAVVDLAGARTLMREVDDLLRRLLYLSGTLTGEAQTLRARLSKECGSSAAGASALSAAELRLLPMLPHPSVDTGDRRGIVPVTQHHQVPGNVDLPQAGCLLPQPGGHPRLRTRAAGELTIRPSSIRNER